MNKNRIISWLILGLSVISCILFVDMQAFAASTDDITIGGLTVYSNAENGYIALMNDHADLLTAEEEAALTEYMKPITQYGNVAFVTIDENRSSTSNYAYYYYDSTFGYSSGTVFLIDMDNRTIYIHSDGAVYSVVTDTYADVITDNAYREASKENYFKCACVVYDQIYKILNGQKIAQPMKYISNALLALIIAMVILFWYVKAVSKPKKPSAQAQLNAIHKKCELSNPKADLTGTTKRYIQSSSGGGSRGGSRGGGGGGRHGGGGGHRF